MITLMLFISAIWKVEGNSDWRESAFKIRSIDCNTPVMINKLHLPEVVSFDVRSNQDLIITLKYWEHRNARALSDLNNRVENGGCTTWLNVHNDKDYLHPLKREQGLFARRLGEITPHLAVQPCNNLYPMVVKSTTSGCISVSI